MIETEYKSLINLFQNDVDAAIDYSEAKLIGFKYSSFADFLEKNKNSKNVSWCQKSWSTPHLVVKCSDCCKTEESFICLNCFLNGNHKGHKYSFAIVPNGHCCCGDDKLLSRQGFCSNHKPPHHHPQKYQLEENERDLCLKIFVASLGDFVFSCIYKPEESIKIIDWLFNFIKLGDGYCRLISLAFCCNDKLKRLFRSCDVFTRELCEKLASFCGSLSNDSLFAKSLAEASVSEYSTVLKMISRNIASKADIEKFSPMICVLYTALQQSSITLSLEKSDICWWDLIVKGLEMHFSIASKGYIQCDQFDTDQTVIALVKSVGELITKKDQQEKTEIFFEKLFKFLSKFALYPEIHMNMEDDPSKYFFLVFFQQISGYIGSFILNMEDSIDTKLLYEQVMKIINAIEDKESKWSRTVIEEHIYKEPVYRSGHTSSHLPFYILLMSIIWKDLGHAWNILRDVSADYLDTYSDFCRSLILLPLRLFALIDAKDSKIVESIPKSMLYLLNTAISGDNLPLRTLPLFALIQVCLGTVEDKEKIINAIAYAYGVFDATMTNNECISNYRFAYFKFIEALLTCKDSFERNFDSIGRQIILISALSQDFTIDDIEENVSPLIMNKTKTDETMLELIDVVKKDGLSIAKPKTTVGIHPCAVWASISDSINCFSSIIASNRDKVLESNFMPIIQKDNFDFKSALLSPTLMASIFTTLSADFKSEETLQIILHLLIERSKIENDEMPINKITKIKAENETELIEQMPVKFKEIMSAMIEYRGAPATNITALIESQGLIGEEALQIMKIKNCAVNQTSFEEERKDKAKLAKEKALLDLKKDSKQWETDCPKIDLKNEIKCGICHQTGDLNDFVLPALLYPTSFPNLVHEQNTGEELQSKYISLEICDQVFHRSCLPEDSDMFVCPIDRQTKNTILPFISKESEVTKEKMEIVENELRKSGFELDSELILNSLIGVLETSEMRTRTFPDCLRKPRAGYFISYFNKLLLYMKENFDLEKEEDPLKRCIIASLFAENQFEGFIEEFNNQINKVNENSFIIARQSAIFLHFATNSLNEEKLCQFCSFHNENLSSEYLSRFFKVPIEKIELKPFEFKPLPEELYQFELPPFNCDIEDMSTDLCYCLLTGRVFTREKLVAYLKSGEFGDISLILFIRGSSVGQLLLYSSFFNKEIKLKSIYLDSFGEEDIGLRSGRKTTLNQQMLSEYKELILSGEWTSLLHF